MWRGQEIKKIASFIKKWVGETRFSKDATKNHEKCWKSMIFKRKVNISLLCCLIKRLLLIMMVENVFLKSFPKHFQHFSISWTCRRLWTFILGSKWTKIVYFPKKRRLRINEFNLKWLLFTVIVENIFLNTVLKIPGPVEESGPSFWARNWLKSSNFLKKGESRWMNLV